jgi:hypothetical protein
MTVVFALAILATNPPEYCGADLRQASHVMAPAAGGPTPTLAPPRNSVIVRVEVNEPGFEVGWADGQ